MNKSEASTQCFSKEMWMIWCPLKIHFNITNKDTLVFSLLTLYYISIHAFFFVRIIFIRIIRLKSWKIKNNSRITQGSDPAQSHLWMFLLHLKYEIIEYLGPVCSLLHLQEGPHGYFLPYLHWMWRRVSCHLNF